MLHIADRHSSSARATCRRATLLAAALLGTSGLVGAGEARATPVWKGTTSTDWYDPQNWSPAAVPTLADDTTIDTTNPNPTEIAGSNAHAKALVVGDQGKGSLTVYGGATLDVSSATVGKSAGSAGTGLVTGANSQWNVSGTLIVGNSGTGALSVGPGGLLTSDKAIIANGTNGTGNMVLSGAGAHWTNTNEVSVGASGNGKLQLAGGAFASDTFAYVGRNAGSQGFVRVDGAGTLWQHASAPTIGESGTGNVQVTNGGHATSSGLTLGRLAGSVGTLIVDGTGSQWDAGNGAVIVGGIGTGSLKITNGGKLTDQTGSVGDSSGIGSVLVSDVGSSWVNSGLLYIGSGSDVTVANGATLFDTDGSIGYHQNTLSTATVTGPGSTWSNSGDLDIGFAADASVSVLKGGAINVFGTTRVGPTAGASGLLAIDGAGSIFRTNTMSIGVFGKAEVDVTNGGALFANSTVDVGEEAGAVNIVKVDGAGSILSGSTITIGVNGSGIAVIAKSGVVTTNFTELAHGAGSYGEVDVDGAGSLLAGGFLLEVGVGGKGVLAVANGGTAEAGGSDIGVGSGSHGSFSVDSGAVFDVDGAVTIGKQAGSDGSGAVSGGGKLKVGGTATIGDAGKGDVIVFGGGGLSAADGTLGRSAGGYGALLVEDAGSIASFANGLIAGDAGTGAILLAGQGVLAIDGGTPGSHSGTLTLAAQAGSIASLTIGGSTLPAPDAPGDLAAAKLVLGAGAGTIFFNHTSTSYSFAPAISGLGTISVTAGTTILTADSSGFSGSVHVDAGPFGATLLVDGTLGGSVSVGGTAITGPSNFGGVGTATGAVAVGVNGFLLGAAGQTLTMGSLTLDAASRTNVTLGAPGNAALFKVIGDLALGGTLNVTGTTGFGYGLYRLFDYGGTLTDNGLTVGSIDAGQPSDYSVQTASPGHVNLLYGTVAAADRSFWDGEKPGNAQNGIVDGGSGTWSLASPTFTDAAGTACCTMSPQPTFVIFSGAPGTVTVDNSAGQVGVTGMQFSLDGYTVNGGSIALAGNQAQIRVGDGSIAGAGYAATIASALTGTAQLQKMDLGTLILTGDNSYSGGTSVVQGRLQIGNGGTSGSIVGDVDVAKDATLAFFRSDASTYGGTVSGAGTLAKEGASTLTLSAAETLSGPVLVNGGALALTGKGDLSSASSVAVGGTFDISGLSHGSTINALLGNGIVALGANTLTVANSQYGFAGSIQGSGGLTIGGGTLVLSGASTYTGTTRIAAGVQLQVGVGAAGSVVSDVINDGVLAFGRSDNVSYGGTISGTGSLLQLGIGTLTLTGTNSYTGGTTIAAGTLAGSTSSIHGNVLDNGALVFNQAADGLFTGKIGGTGSLTKAGAGALTLSGVNSYSGGTIVSAGSLIGDTASLQGNIVDNAALVFNQANAGIFAGKVSGTGSLTKQGAGNLTLTGANSYTGGTNVAAGTLTGTTTSLQGNIADNAALAFNQASDGSFAGLISGTGSVTKQGGGNLTLTGANSYGGGTTVSGGTLTGDAASLQGNISDNAALVFNQATAGTYAGPLSGTGTFTKQGAARLNLTGDSSGFTGATSVVAGLLSVNGSLAKSVVTVGSGATLGGSGTVGGVLVLSGGNVAPGNSIGTMNVAGNVTFQPGSVFTVEIDPTTGASDRIAASGTASLAGSVNILSPGQLHYGSSFRILTAEQGISGTFAALTVNGQPPATGPFLLTGLTYSANAVDFRADVNRVALGAAGATPNQAAVAGAAAQLPGSNAILAALAESSVAGAQATFDTLSGEIHAAVPRQAFEDARAVRDAALMRSRSGEGRGVWAQAFGSWGATSGNGNYARSERSVTGLIGGADLAAGESARIGIAAGYTKGRTDVTARGSRADLETVHVGIYGSAEAGALRLRGGAFWGNGHADTRRGAAFGTTSESERARYDVDSWQAYAEAGYRIGFAGGAVEPFANLTALGIKRHGFIETGGITALTGAAQTDALQLATLGLHLEARGDGPVVLKGMVGWRHAFGDRGGAATVGLTGAPAFTVLGPQIAKEAVVAEAGITARLGRSATLGAGYSGTFGKGQDHSAKVTLSMPF